MIDIMQMKGIQEEIAWHQFWQNKTVKTDGGK